MQKISRRQFALIFTTLTLNATEALNAQSTNRAVKVPVQGAKNTATVGKSSTTKSNVDETSKTQPKSSPADEEISPELENLLAKWESNSAKIKTLHGEQTRTEINHVFNTEKRSAGKFFLETPDRGRIDIGEVKVPAGEVSKYKGQDDIPYKIESGQSERWICTGDSIMVINDSEREYQKEDIPESDRGANIVHSPLPFLFGMKADEARVRFRLTMTRSEKDPKYVTISAVPLLPKDKQNYDVAHILLDTTTFLPVRVSLQLVEQKHEIVYRFKNVKSNDAGVSNTIKTFWSGDPYKPRLVGYRLVLPNTDEFSAENKSANASSDDKKPSVKGKGPIVPASGIKGKSAGGKSTASGK